MEKYTKVFKALSDRNRLRILAAVQSQSDLCACHIATMLDISAASTSVHMQLLLDAELITQEKRGRWVHYSINAGSNNYKYIKESFWQELLETSQSCQDQKRLQKNPKC